MDVIGVDPSLTCTGVATVIDGVLTTSRIRTSPEPGLIGTRRRIRTIVGQVLKAAPAECLTVIEAPIIPRSQTGGSVLERAWLFGLLVDQLALRGSLVQVRPSTRAMYATGNGKADKKAVLAAVRAMHPGLRIADDNEADAAVFAAMGSRFLGVPVDAGLTGKQLSAMRSVVWSIEGKQ